MDGCLRAHQELREPLLARDRNDTAASELGKEMVVLFLELRGERGSLEGFACQVGPFLRDILRQAGSDAHGDVDERLHVLLVGRFLKIPRDGGSDVAEHRGLGHTCEGADGGTNVVQALTLVEVAQLGQNVLCVFLQNGAGAGGPRLVGLVGRRDRGTRGDRRKCLGADPAHEAVLKELDERLCDLAEERVAEVVGVPKEGLGELPHLLVHRLPLTGLCDPGRNVRILRQLQHLVGERRQLRGKEAQRVVRDALAQHVEDVLVAESDGRVERHGDVAQDLLGAQTGRDRAHALLNDVREAAVVDLVHVHQLAKHTVNDLSEVVGDADAVRLALRDDLEKASEDLQ
eukprot:PhM_4_TR10714/c0_g1_i1/m.63761